MIKKFKEIKNLAVFQNFNWDSSVLDKDNRVIEFKEINVIYGRNYSGKTTLSRIARALETGNISNKFEDATFNVLFSDNSEVKQDDLTGHGKKIRVFNEDFVRDNLKFVINPDLNVEPFAILGVDNQIIETEIAEIEKLIGSNTEGEESGLYLQLKFEKESCSEAQVNHDSKNGLIISQLNTKATSRETGIKYKPEKFGDQNYTIRKLEGDIENVLEESYTPISNQEQNELEALIIETVNSEIRSITPISLGISDLNISVEALVTQKVSEVDKIEELVKDAILNKWVKEGRVLHKDKRTKCAFCKNEISSHRWRELENHFDQKSQKLEDSLQQRISEINNKIHAIAFFLKPEKAEFYSKFHKKYDRISELLRYSTEKYIEQLNSLKQQLEDRKNDILNVKSFNKVIDYSKRIGWILEILKKLIEDSNDFSTSLSSEQETAKNKLRLKEVSDFIKTINYKTEIESIKELKKKLDEVVNKRDSVSNEIYEKQNQIELKRKELKDESKGAEKVNEYLNNFFGHNFLSLLAVEYAADDTTLKKIRFEVIRDNKKAYHLSEGETSLIAFCYFMAKLDDIETKGAKPIIWIDDPISSLDGNHIFFVYSILNSEIVNNNIFGQLFISTHNLDFLKYLRRLSGFFQKEDGRMQEYSKSYFMVNRIDKNSTIVQMPKYMKEFVTEFNYLFHQIYNCSKITNVDDSNYTTFYNFGNNARKFLEVYLYYKYPDSTEESKKLQKFFGGEKIPSVFTDRINNEYSHLSAVFERGAIPVEVPEMKSAAELIIRRIKETDEDQYNSFVLSIGAQN